MTSEPLNWFMLDASALVKRFAPELGADVIHHLFAHVATERLMCLMIGVAEVAATLARKRNGGHISPSVFAASMVQLRTEVLEAAQFTKLPADNALINNSIPLTSKHAINSVDAIVLRTALDVAAQLLNQGDNLVLVAADQRLLKAAQAEGLVTFDPERQDEVALQPLLTS